MPPVRSLLKDAVVEAAKGKRKCGRESRHLIAKGQLCLVVVVNELGARKSYCFTCAEPILNKAESDLQKLRTALTSGTPTEP